MRLLVVSLFMLLAVVETSCRRGKLIGREVQLGDNDIFLHVTDSFLISARTVQAKRERTDERFTGMLGSYIDPVFGLTEISFCSQYHLQEEGFHFPDNAVFDSAFVSFKLTGGYREKLVPTKERTQMHFKVYELSQDLYLDSIYFSDQSPRIQPNIIGEFLGPVGLFDTIYHGSEAQPAQIRIRLNDSWGEKMIRSDTSFFESNEHFVQYFKGLAVVPQPANQLEGGGAIFYFNPLDWYTRITIHYHTENDTTTYFFVTNSLTANFSTFKHNYPPTQVGQVFDDTLAGNNRLYIQATTGTDIQVELKDLVDKLGPSPKIINMAELLIPVDTNQPFYHLQKLAISRKLENGSAEFLPDQLQTGVREIDGSFDPDSLYYRFLITQYVQEIIRNYKSGQDNTETLLVSAFGNNILANRSVVYGPNPTDPKTRKMRVVVTYTPL